MVFDGPGGFHGLPIAGVWLVETAERLSRLCGASTKRGLAHPLRRERSNFPYQLLESDGLRQLSEFQADLKTWIFVNLICLHVLLIALNSSVSPVP